MTTLDGGVIIKKGGGGGTTPVPPSGGESGDSEWQYFDVRNCTIPEGQWEAMMVMLPTIVAMRTDDGDWVYIGSPGMFAMLGTETARARLKNIGINMGIKQYSSMTGNQLMSFKELELAQGQSIASMLASFGCPPITKEQFYSLD